MRVTGSVRGVRDFGAFVDFGGPRDGLLHTLRYKVGEAWRWRLS